MHTHRLRHLLDAVLLHQLASLVRRDRTNLAMLLAYIAEVDERRLYRPAGYPSMYAYCLGELHLSEDEAYKRIRAARTAREYPVLFAAVAEGRLHLTAVLLLAPHLTPVNVGELVAAATHKGREAIELWIARRFPQAEALRLDDGISALPAVRFAPGPVAPGDQFAPGPVAPSALSPEESVVQLAPGPVAIASELAPGPVAGPRPRVAPLSPGRFAVQITIGQATHDKLRHAQALLGHAVPSGDVALVLDRALDTLIVKLEKRKFARSGRAPRQPRPALAKRQVPAHVRRDVWARDGGQCTFVGEGGHHCAARARLEFDHVEPVARGGRATTGGIRLLCRSHNQHAAEQAFGAEFMRGKRQAARRVRAARIDPRAAEASRGEAGATIEERLRGALRSHRPRVFGRTDGRIAMAGASSSPASGIAPAQDRPAPGP